MEYFDLATTMKEMPLQLENQSISLQSQSKNQMLQKFMPKIDSQIDNYRLQIFRTTDLSTGFSVSPLRAFGENFACYFVQRKLPEIFQTTTIAEFQSAFEEVINNETWISEPLQISLFISGLKPELRLKLLFNRPSSLMEAYSLARAYEASMDETQNSSPSDVLNNASAISTDTQSMKIEETRLEAKPGLFEGIEWVASSETQSFTIKTPLGRTIATDAFNLNALVGYFPKYQRSWGEVVVQKLRVLLIREHSNNSIEWGTAERFKVGNGLIRGNLVSDPLISTWWVFDKGKSIHSWYLHQVDNDLEATPKAIMNLMGVQGLTLYHLKSHLQKFRLGKTARRLWRREFVPANYCRRKDERLPGMNLEDRGTSMSNAFDRNSECRTKTLGTETYGNLHLLVEPQAAVKNLEVAEKFSGINMNQQAGTSATTAVKLEEEEVAAAKPALLPLFPPIPACGINCPPHCSPEWSEFLDGGGNRSVAPRPIENGSMDDYLNSLGYSSSEFALTKSPESCRASMIFRSFFDEVASFSKVDDNELTADDRVMAMEAGDLSARVTND